MLAVDVKVHIIHARHRVSLFRLLKVELGEIEPCFLKIPGVAEETKAKPRPHDVHGVSEFGSMMLVADNGEYLSKWQDNVAIRVEIYNDRGPLDLICAGQLNTTLAPAPIGYHSRDPDEIRCLWLQRTASSSRFAIPIMHHAQGKFQISAGSLEMSVTVYRVNINALDNYDFNLTSSAPRDSTDSELQALSKEPVEIIEIITAKEMSTDPMPSSEVVPPENNGDDLLNEEFDDDDINTTHEDLLLDDRDSIDDFVDTFLRTRREATASRLLHGQILPGDGRSEAASTVVRTVTSEEHLETKEAPAQPAVKRKKSTKKSSKKPQRYIGAAADRGRWLYK